MADSHIRFKHGDELTGDSDERGVDTGADGGAVSIKPITDGERAYQAVFRRASENLRQRTEILRVFGEDQKFLQDQLRWIIAAGYADGTSPEPLPRPSVTSWLPSGVFPGKGLFTLSYPIVIQPINTPAADKVAAKTYSFTLGTIGTVTFTVLAANGWRAYSGANLIKIVWEQATAAELAGALVPDYCDMEISGDPDHILTITVRDDAATSINNLTTAAGLLSPTLASMGLVMATGGVTSTLIDYDTIAEPDYTLCSTFEREVHYLPVATFTGYFAGGGYLSDGDTLAISWPYLTKPDPFATPRDGRRQSIPSNPYPPGTTVVAAQLFNTTLRPDLIPLSIPLCKRIGDDLFWIDGTFVKGDQTTYPVYFGEHGNTIDRIVAATTLIVGKPTVIQVLGLVSATEFKLTGDFYIGKADEVAARNYFRLVENANIALPLTDSSKRSVFVGEVHKDNAGVIGAIIDPAADADANGFYTNPWVKLGFEPGMMGANYTGNLKCICNEKGNLFDLPQTPATSFPIMQYLQHDHAINIPVKNDLHSTPLHQFSGDSVQTALINLLGWVNGIQTEDITVKGTWIHDVTAHIGTDITALEGRAKGAGSGIVGSGINGAGVKGQSTSGYGVVAQGYQSPGIADKASFLLSPQRGTESTPANITGSSQDMGAMWLDNNNLWVRKPLASDLWASYRSRAIVTHEHVSALKGGGNILVSSGAATVRDALNITSAEFVYVLSGPTESPAKYGLKINWTVAFSTSAYNIVATSNGGMNVSIHFMATDYVILRVQDFVTPGPGPLKDIDLLLASIMICVVATGTYNSTY